MLESGRGKPLSKYTNTAAFEAAQQRKEKPWQSWDEAFSERLAKQPARQQFAFPVPCSPTSPFLPATNAGQAFSCGKSCSCKRRTFSGFNTAGTEIVTQECRFPPLLRQTQKRGG